MVSLREKVDVGKNISIVLDELEEINAPIFEKSDK